jgi:hypothetical protein
MLTCGAYRGERCKGTVVRAAPALAALMSPNWPKSVAATFTCEVHYLERRCLTAGDRKGGLRQILTSVGM